MGLMIQSPLKWKATFSINFSEFILAIFPPSQFKAASLHCQLVFYAVITGKQNSSFQQGGNDTVLFQIEGIPHKWFLRMGADINLLCKEVHTHPESPLIGELKDCQHSANRCLCAHQYLLWHLWKVSEISPWKFTMHFLFQQAQPILQNAQISVHASIGCPTSHVKGGWHI